MFEATVFFFLGTAKLSQNPVKLIKIKSHNSDYDEANHQAKNYGMLRSSPDIGKFL